MIYDYSLDLHIEKLKQHPNERIMIRELFDLLGRDSFPFLNILFALPCIIPVPAPPGYTTIFGLIIMFISFQMLLQYKAFKAPTRISSNFISKDFIIRSLEKASIIQNWLNKRIKERQPEQFTSKYFKFHFSLLIIFNGLILALPVPVGNILAGLAIVILNLSYLRKDSLFYIIGIILSIIATITTLLLGTLFVAIIVSSFNVLS